MSLKDDQGKFIELKDERLLSLFVNNASHFHRDMNFVPQCNTNDGYFYLTYIDDKAGPIQAWKFMLALEDGLFFRKNLKESTEENTVIEHAGVGDFHYHKITEFRLEPDQNLVDRHKDKLDNIAHGWISIDGEAFKPENMTCKIIPQAIRIFW